MKVIEGSDTHANRGVSSRKGHILPNQDVISTSLPVNNKQGKLLTGKYVEIISDLDIEFH